MAVNLKPHIAINKRRVANKIHNSLFPKLLSDPLLQSRIQRLKSLPSPSLRRRIHGIHGPLKPTQKVILDGQDNDYSDLPTSDDGMYDDLDNNDQDSSLEILSNRKKPMNEDSENNNLSEDVSSEFSEPENSSNNRNRNRNKIRNEDRAKRRSKSQGSTRPLQQQISHVPTPGGNHNTSSSNTSNNTRAIGRPKAKKKSKQKKTKKSILVPPAMNVPVNEMNQLSFEDRIESMLILTGADPRQKKKYKQIKYALTLFCRNYGM